MRLLEALQKVYDLIGEINAEEVEELYHAKEAAEAHHIAAKRAQEELSRALAEQEDSRSAFTRELAKIAQDLEVARNTYALEVKRLESLTQAARDELKMVQVEINSAKENHDQILNSVESLRRRFG